MGADNDCNHNLDQLEPLTGHDLKLVEDKYEFSYKQGIGKLIYTMVTCRLDISFPLIKIS